ncbi:MAG: carotenoid biosynthesis protein [Pseudomonadota bacterium]
MHRPYVFAFLAAYLILAWRLWGWRRAILWLVSGYLIAWASEYSSIRNGFPYGEYHYIYENLKGELLFGGVPFFDSLSYPFLIFAGYTTAKFIINSAPSPLVGEGRGEGGPSIAKTIFLGALLTMLLDVIIDPLATMGDKWFLGRIHFYAHPGWYFGVPMTNFAGWFIVALAVIAANNALWRLFPSPLVGEGQGEGGSRQWLCPAFYAGIALFNIAVTFWIGEWKLGLASSAILCAIGAAALLPSRGQR